MTNEINVEAIDAFKASLAWHAGQIVFAFILIAILLGSFAFLMLHEYIVDSIKEKFSSIKEKFRGKKK